MVISPPFLPVPEPGESDAAWLARAMKQQAADAIDSHAQEGSFPISAGHMWHTGIHLSAPPAPGGFEPVRAIGDGQVIYVRQPTPHSTDPAHPLNYSPGGQPFWSDDGCVIVRHATDIGATGEVTTSFTWYTLTMHLGTLEPAVRVGARIYRKDVIGRPGKVYGAQADIHLEVCCDETQLIRLTGCKPVWREPFDGSRPEVPKTDGRTDAVFGDLYIYLPTGTATSLQPPTCHLRSPATSRSTRRQRNPPAHPARIRWPATGPNAGWKHPADSSLRPRLRSGSGAARKRAPATRPAWRCRSPTRPAAAARPPASGRPVAARGRPALPVRRAR